MATNQKPQQNRQQQQGQGALLFKFNSLLNSTPNFTALITEAAKTLIISEVEKDTIIKQFSSEREKLAAFYLLLNAKSCSVREAIALLKKTGNDEAAASLLETEHDNHQNHLQLNRKNFLEFSKNEGNVNIGNRIGGEDKSISEEEIGKWLSLQKLITGNIDRLSSHTRNLGLVLCFATGVGLITGKDREIIANSSELEIDQLKMFYWMVGTKKADAYGKLLKVLKMTSNNWALDVLKIEDENKEEVEI